MGAWRSVMAFGCGLAIGLGSALAAEDTVKWAFEDHPATPLDVLPRAHQNKVHDILIDEGCEAAETFLIGLYVARHAAFAPLALTNEGRRSWRDAVSYRVYKDVLYCMAGKRFRTVGLALKAAGERRTLYCGRFTQLAEEPRPREMARWIKHMHELARRDRSSAIRELIIAEFAFPFIRLNDDFALYLRLRRDILFARLMRRDLGARASSYDVSYLVAQLGDKRADRVRALARAGDFASIVRETPPCPVKEE